MSKLLAVLLGSAAMLVLAAGCRTAAETAPVALRDKVEAEIDLRGSSYRYCDHTASLAFLRAYGDRLAAALLASDLPENERAKAAAMVKTLLYGLTVAGIDGQIATGSSSSALAVPAGSPVAFRNRTALFHAPGEEGILWRLFGTANHSLAQDLGAVPADALLAADLHFEPALLGELVKSLHTLSGGSDNLYDLQLKPILEAMGGNWGILVLPLGAAADGDGDEVGVIVAMPDRDNRLFKLIARMRNAAATDELILPPLSGLSAESPLLTRLDNGITVFYSSARARDRFVAEQPRLTATPEWPRLSAGLPQSGAGFVYLSGNTGAWLTRLIARHAGIAIPVELPNALCIIEKRPDGLVFTTNSSWDIATGELVTALAPAAVLFSRKALSNFEKLRGDSVRRAELESCRTRFGIWKEIFKNYAAKHQGNYPADDEIPGLLEIARAEKVAPGMFLCPAAHGDKAALKLDQVGPDNISLVYLGGTNSASSPYRPVLFDWPLNHRDRANVLFANGEVQTIDLERLRSCRRLISYLHSVHRYDAREFQDLLNRADRIDAKYLRK